MKLFVLTVTNPGNDYSPPWQQISDKSLFSESSGTWDSPRRHKISRSTHSHPCHILCSPVPTLARWTFSRYFLTVVGDPGPVLCLFVQYWLLEMVHQCRWNFESRRYFGEMGLKVQENRCVPLLPKVIRAEFVGAVLVHLDPVWCRLLTSFESRIR